MEFILHKGLFEIPRPSEDQDIRAPKCKSEKNRVACFSLLEKLAKDSEENLR